MKTNHTDAEPPDADENDVLQLGLAMLETTVIRVDGGTQTRAAIDDEAVKDYAEAMANGKALPPIVVFHDGVECWLADGFHRLEAARQAGIAEILVDIKTGTKLDAVRHALGANHSHGLRRTNADKRRCIEIALQHFGDQSTRALAELCGVGHQLVDDVRRELDESSSFEVRIGRDGKQRKMPNIKAEASVHEPMSLSTSIEVSADEDLAQEKSAPEPLGGDAAAVNFTLVDGTVMQGVNGYFGAKWLGDRLREWERRSQPLTSAQREWVLKGQSLMVKLVAMLNNCVGESPSAETLHWLQSVLGTLEKKTSQYTEARVTRAYEAALEVVK